MIIGCSYSEPPIDPEGRHGRVVTNHSPVRKERRGLEWPPVRLADSTDRAVEALGRGPLSAG